MLPLVYSMTSPRHPVKQEIFETDVGSCVTSLKKNLQNIRAMDKACLEMAQPNGLRYALQSAPLASHKAFNDLCVSQIIFCVELTS